MGERAAFAEACAAARSRGASVGIVPTMGALHDGHRSLLERARGADDFVAMTLFVNPLQFGDAADLSFYPGRRGDDLAAAEAAGCDVVFAPSAGEMYPGGDPEVTVDPGPLGGRLEGAARPGHFRGVLTVVAKLLNLAGPCRAYFGEKDAQQLELVRRMVRDLDVSAEIVACPTVRAPDGLALASRNARLSPAEREAAPVLFRALSAGVFVIGAGERSAGLVGTQIAGVLAAEPLARTDYLAVIDDVTWDEVGTVPDRARLLVAAWIGDVRLIDGVAVRSDAASVPASG
ncbi:MAG TPA: pantoate--beta-alanine ligase, partial [Actinomycetota bacterium]|nr:pantoate--beta-alanine ligase [Actinomycetota bacterium]